MQTTTADQIRATVRQAYGAIASEKRQGGCCAAGTSCSSATEPSPTRLGYTDADVAAAPDASELGLGCGNPQVIADLRAGERVLDLGSGGGFDAFLAARQVGPAGRVIGVDMTPEMVALARANAAVADWSNVDFRLGHIEDLPVEDASIDVILSNCVINLAPDKAAVFREAFRVLAPGGRLAIADMVAVGGLPAAVAADPAAYVGCLAGAASVADLDRVIADAGFERVRITVQAWSRDMVQGSSVGSDAEMPVASALIEAVKPALPACCGPSPQSTR